MAKQANKAGKVQSLVITGRESEYVKAREAALGKLPQQWRGLAEDVARKAEVGESIHEEIVTCMLGALAYWNTTPAAYTAFRDAVVACYPTDYVRNGFKGWCAEAAVRAGIKDWSKPQSAEAKRKQAARGAAAPATVKGRAQSAPQAEPAPTDEWSVFLSWANQNPAHKARALAWFKATLAAEQAAAKPAGAAQKKAA